MTASSSATWAIPGLYLIWNGAMRKLTSDHSPVGEREDRGELSETEAMLHPRRHEVFRDVGTRRREPDEEEFVEMKEFLFKPDAAMLLCSDGLSDLITSAEMSEIIDRYDGDAEQVAHDLVDAANRAGGKDNITAMFVAGSEFLGNDSPQMAEARARHSITRAREGAVRRRQHRGRFPGCAGPLTSRVAFLIYGFAIGVAAGVSMAVSETARPRLRQPHLGNLCSVRSNSEIIKLSASSLAA